MTVGLAGALIAGCAASAYDVQDLWPDTLRATGMLNSERERKVVGAVCNWIYRRSAHVVVAPPGLRRLRGERGVPVEKISLIYNWCDQQALQSPLGGAVWLDA